MVPKSLLENLDYRTALIDACSRDDSLKQAIWIACSRDMLFWVNALVWAYDHQTQKNLNNHFLVARDDARTWTAPADTGVAGQAPG